MRITAAGNVGIGTTSPDAPLHVASTGTATTLLLESTDADAADAPILELYRNSSSPANGDDLGQILWSREKSDGSKTSVTKMYGEINTVDNSDRLMINVSSSGGSGFNDYEYIRLDGGVRDIIFNETGQDIDVRMEGSSVSGLFFLDASTDRIGIGTTSPAKLLHLESTMPELYMVDSDATNDPNFRIFNNGGNANYRADDDDTGTGGAHLFYTSGTEKMRLADGGNLGIGVTSPSSILHVKEASTINSVADSARMIVAANGGDSYIHLMESTDGHNIRHTASDNSLRFRSTLAGSDLMTLTSGGNLGIGETTPAFPLEVNGFISTASGIVHMGDTNNTISFGTDTQSFNTAGSARMTIASDGAVAVVGAFSAATKSFDIEHPTKEGKRLHHGSLEGPEHGVYHRGISNSRVVDLPDYWTGLVDEDSITVQLTPKGQFQSLYVSKIEGNRVYVDSDHGEPLDFYFNVYGERKDVDKLVVEY